MLARASDRILLHFVHCTCRATLANRALGRVFAANSDPISMRHPSIPVFTRADGCSALSTEQVKCIGNLLCAPSMAMRDRGIALWPSFTEDPSLAWCSGALVSGRLRKGSGALLVLVVVTIRIVWIRVIGLVGFIRR